MMGTVNEEKRKNKICGVSLEHLKFVQPVLFFLHLNFTLRSFEHAGCFKIMLKVSCTFFVQ